ncbi:hypothetical protein AB3662_10175 [Sorangium cellulosum]|uniref:hypothetical protein n=1 Tax=Sorangium cellulosum TaxID=56 RepID=UPI003D9A2A93
MMLRLATAILMAHVLVGCGGEAADAGEAAAGGDEAAAGGGESAAAGGARECGLPQGPPTGSCSAGEECSFHDGGCDYDSHCKDGSWATIRTCQATKKCPPEGLTAGDSCSDEGAGCRYDEGGACISDLTCTGGVWAESDPGC